MRAKLPLLLSLLLLTLGVGCRLLQTAADVPGQTVRAVTPGKKSQPAVDPVELQQTLLRFADEYQTRMVLGADHLRTAPNGPGATEILRCKIDLATATCAIVSGPNPIANLLDLTIFVTVTRMALEEYWVPKIYGDSARPLLESSRHAETEIWQFVSTVLTPAHQTELRRTIETWRRQHPQPESIVAARAVGFVSQVAKAGPGGAAAPEGLLNLLRLDPLSSLDPAVREIAQTRLFAERVLFVTQKMPTLLRWQMELLSVNTVAMPAVQQLVTNADQIALSVERFAAVAEKLPEQVRAERTEILQALQAQEKEVASLLTSGTQMSDSLNTTLTTFDALMKRFGVGETNNAPPATNAAPFRVLDYAQTAAQLEATARQLTELLVTLDRTIGSTNLAQLSAQVAPVVAQAQAGGKEVVDYAFGRAMMLLAVLLGAALIYHFLISRRVFSKTNPS